MKCSGCKFDLPDGMDMCIPCARQAERICNYPGCARPVHIDTVPMVDRPIHHRCLGHLRTPLPKVTK